MPPFKLLFPILLISLILSGCATRFACQQKGGPAWREWKNDHFLLRTDLPADRAQTILQQFEHMRAPLVTLIAHSEDDVGAIKVIAFATRDEYVEFMGNDRTAGVFGKHLEGGEGAIIISGELDFVQRRIIAHELAHYFSSRIMGRQPKWFAEGLASYFETIGDPARDGTLSAGKMQEHFWRMLGDGSVPTKDVLEWQGVKEREADYYAKSWLLFHFLTSHYSRQFAGFKARLARSEEPRAAWNVSFPAWSLVTPAGTGKLDEELENYRLIADFNRRDLTISAGSPFAVRPFSSAEVHAMRLYNRQHWTVEEQEAEVAEALAEDPGHVAALTVRAARQPQDALALARIAVNNHPDDALAWRLLGSSLDSRTAPKEREEAFSRALRLAPNRPQSFIDLGMALSGQERAQDALPLYRRAVKLAPESLQAAFLYAYTLTGLGMCTEAEEFGTRTSNMLDTEHSSEQQRVQLRETLNEMRKKCRPAERARSQLPERSAGAGGL